MFSSTLHCKLSPDWPYQWGRRGATARFASHNRHQPKMKMDIFIWQWIKILSPVWREKSDRWRVGGRGGQLHHALSHKVFFVSPKVWWGHGRISALRGSGIGSLHKQSCCAWWRRNNVSSSTSCSGTAARHILSLLPAVPRRRVITGAKSLFTWRDNALCNWLMLGERGLALCRFVLSTAPWTAPSPYHRWQTLPPYGSGPDHLVWHRGTWRCCLEHRRNLSWAHKHAGLCQPLWRLSLHVQSKGRRLKMIKQPITTETAVIEHLNGKLSVR